MSQLKRKKVSFSYRKLVINHYFLAAGQVNRGFCFIDFESHMAAAEVKKNLLKRTLLLFGRYTGIVDWADPVNDPGEDTMKKVKILYAKGWKPERTESEIRALFAEFGTIEKVKKITNYSFIHFADRECALTGKLNLEMVENLVDIIFAAMKHFDGKEINQGEMISVTLAKPDDPNAKLKKIQKHQQRNASHSEFILSRIKLLKFLKFCNFENISFFWKFCTFENFSKQIVLQVQHMQRMAYGMPHQYAPMQQMMHPGVMQQPYMMNPYMFPQGGYMQPQGIIRAGSKRPNKDHTVTSVKKVKQ